MVLWHPLCKPNEKHQLFIASLKAHLFDGAALQYQVSLSRL